MPIEVAFDARMIGFTGIGAHIRSLLGAIAEIPGTGVRFRFLGKPEELAQYEFLAGMGVVQPLRASIYGLREQLLYPPVPQAHAYHFPHYNVPCFRRRPYFVTIHDLIHLVVPDALGTGLKRAYAGMLLRKAARGARAVFTDSQWSANDLEKHLGVDRAKIIVLPNGAPAHWKPMGAEALAQAQSTLALPRRYILSPGVNKPHKNVEFAVRTWATWTAGQREDVHLVLYGVREQDRGRLAGLVAGSAAEKRLHLIWLEQHDALIPMYQGALAVVLPSMYEGFGLPVVEAQRLGVPVIASRTTCLPETAGDGALFFDPHSEAELTARLDELLGSNELRAQLVGKGFANEAHYRWSDAARLVLDAYKREG